MSGHGTFIQGDEVPLPDEMLKELEQKGLVGDSVPEKAEKKKAAEKPNKAVKGAPENKAK